MGIYNSQLSAMMGNYNQILSGYGQAQGNIGNTLGGIYAGYDSAQHNVMNTLGVTGGGWGVAAPAAKQIQQQFEQTQGQNQQGLISRGLGNSSLLAQSNNQAQAFAGQAYAGLGAELAKTAAGYQSQFGLARQAAQMQGLGMQTNLAQSYMGNLAGYNFSPRVDLYGQQHTSNDGHTGYSGGAPGQGGSGGSSGWAMGDHAWANRYGAPNGMGYQGAYGGQNPYAGNQGPQFGGGYGQPIMPNYEQGIDDISGMFGDSGSYGEF